MDADRFDTLVRSVSTAASRRGVVAALAGSLLATLPLLFGSSEVAAKKKRKKKKKQPAVPSVPLAPPPPPA